MGTHRGVHEDGGLKLERVVRAQVPHASRSVTPTCCNAEADLGVPCDGVHGAAVHGKRVLRALAAARVPQLQVAVLGHQRHLGALVGADCNLL